LQGLGVKLIVVACNTASAFALDYLSEVLPVPVLGVIEPGVEQALRRTRGGKIGVIGTSGTIRSGRYQVGLEKGTADLPGVAAERILVQECPLFVPLAEEGLVGHAMTRLAIVEYLQHLKDAQIDTLILGCTHYPLLREDIGRFLGPGVTLVDSADALAEAARTRLAELSLLKAGPAAGGTPGKGKLAFYLSDIPWKFSEVGARFLGKPILNVRSVGLAEMEAAGDKLSTQ
jgi:glutamate racemase